MNPTFGCKAFSRKKSRAFWKIIQCHKSRNALEYLTFAFFTNDCDSQKLHVWKLISRMAVLIYRITRSFTGNLFSLYLRVMWNPQKLLSDYCRCYLLKCDPWRAVMKYVPLSLFQAHSKGSRSKWVTFISSSTISDSPGESRSNERYWYFRTMCTHFYLFYLKRMFVSAAAYALANCLLNKTSPGMVSFFVDCLYAIFFLQK